MKIRSISKLKKIGIGVSAACIILMAAGGIAAWLYVRNNTPPTVSCLEPGISLYVWPNNVQEFADASYGVVVGTVLNNEVPLVSDSEDLPIRLRITEAVKGRALHKGDVLQLCGISGPINFIDGNHTVLVFLGGKDRGWWLPNRSDLGITPQSKDGRFRPKWSDGGKTSTTVDELKKQIK